MTDLRKSLFGIGDNSIDSIDEHIESTEQFPSKIKTKIGNAKVYFFQQAFTLISVGIDLLQISQNPDIFRATSCLFCVEWLIYHDIQVIQFVQFLKPVGYWKF